MSEFSKSVQKRLAVQRRKPMAPVGSAPQGVFQGRNFMTPDVLAYYSGTVRGVVVYVELSGGRGIENEPIFGVTVRRANGARPEPDPSKLFHSRRRAQEYILNGCKENDDADSSE